MQINQPPYSELLLRIKVKILHCKENSVLPVLFCFGESTTHTGNVGEKGVLLPTSLVNMILHMSQSHLSYYYAS